jgi:hypothetical protein
MSLAAAVSPTLEGLPTAPAAKRARSPRATSRQGSQAAKASRKVSFYLSSEAIRRLGIAATMNDSDKSRVLEQVIAESPSLRRWVVSDRAKASAEATQDLSSD